MNDTLNWRKIFSGQYIFTLATAVVFIYGVHNKIINGEQAGAIIMLVVGFYFNKPKDPPAPNTTVTSSTIVSEPIKTDEVKP